MGGFADPPLEPPSPELSVGAWSGGRRPVLGSRVGAADGGVDWLAPTVRPANVPAVTAAPTSVSTPAPTAVLTVIERTLRWARSRSAGVDCLIADSLTPGALRLSDSLL